jgi:two-component system sensor histidine kinase HydH
VHALKEKEVMESSLRRAQRLSSLGTLAAGVAHDVRNPLNAIKLLSSHAMDSVESDPAIASLQLQTIRREVDRLDDIVTGFLSLAKERELQIEPTPIDSLLEECARLVQEDARARKVEIITDLRASNVSLMIDPKQTKRALLNVLINALEASPEGGRVRMFSRVDDAVCAIEVRDDGAGISPETAERAFDPYYTTKSTGTGLGLAITRGIVEEHGGTIELTSSEMNGTQALISLPLG